MVNKVSKIGVFTPPKYPQFSSSRSLITPPNTKYICLKAATKTAQNGVFLCHRKQNRGRSWALPYISLPFNSRQVSQAEEVTVTIFQAGPVRHEGGTHRPSQQPPPAPQPTIRHYRRLRPERETDTGEGGGVVVGGAVEEKAAGPPALPTHPPAAASSPRRPAGTQPPGAEGRRREGRAALAPPAGLRPPRSPRTLVPLWGTEGMCAPATRKNNKLQNK